MSSAPLEDAPLEQQERLVLRSVLAMQRHSWEQGVLGHALLDIGRHDLADLVAHDAVARQTPDGRLGELDATAAVNSAALGEVVLAAARRTDDPALAAAYDRQLTWIATTAPRADDGTVLHLVGTRQVWVDSVYMVVPLLVLAGRGAEALHQLRGHAERLQDPGTGLYAHIWDEDRGGLVRAAHWGTGNGWVAAGLARALRRHPEDDDGFAAFARAHARTVVDACLALRRPDGLFHDVVDDPTTFVEVATAQMLAYAVLTGCADGWLPSSYRGVGDSLLVTARGQVGDDGFVEGACGAPGFDRPGRSAEAQAFFLLAAAASRRAGAQR